MLDAELGSIKRQFFDNRHKRCAIPRRPRGIASFARISVTVANRLEDHAPGG
ncbi:MAG TPA: hypothetical protein VKV32_11420 [Stellaceae bacterium]|nr:hypothetical protein [Stellaceae bacterium]